MSIQLQIGLDVISSYKRLAYTPWHAIAEFIDNSTQAYFNNKSRLDKVYKTNHTKLVVHITTGTDSLGEFIRIKDNSIGMSESILVIMAFAVSSAIPMIDKAVSHSEG